MASTPYKEASVQDFESDCRAFAVQFDTPNVRQAIALCEAGTLTWAQVAEILRASLAEGLATVAA